jgi:periplasmic protein TonB
MFEGSLVESRGLVASGTARWTALGSITLQCAVAGLLIAIPLFHPEGLPTLSDAPRLLVPLPPKPPVVPIQVEHTTASSEAMSVPAASPAPAMVRPLILTRPGEMTEGPPAAYTDVRIGGSGSNSLSALVGVGLGPGPTVSVVPKKSGPLQVSSGVTAGLLISPIQPVYPSLARAARVEGTVVMEAVISKTGRIESLHAVSGPEMLRRAALDAVQAARYQPYTLNGAPTEVQTTITVNFRLGS